MKKDDFKFFGIAIAPTRGEPQSISLTEKVMDQAFALNLFSDLGFSGNAVKPQSLEGVSEGLFKSLLTKENQRTADTVDEDLQDTGIPLGMASWPAGSEQELTAYLENRGISGEEAVSIVRGAKGADGSIRLDRFVAAAHGRIDAQSGGERDLMVASRDVPRLQEVFFRLGLGAEGVKALIERGTDGKGNVLLSKIVAALSEKFRELNSMERLAGLLSRLGINCQPVNTVQYLGKDDLEGVLRTFAETSSEDAQKHIKTVLAQVLREKGVPPEKVKTFLEGMNVTYARDVSDSSPTKAGEIALWDGLMLRQQHAVKQDPWTEKILAILKEGHTGAQQAGDKEGLFPGFLRSGEDAGLNPMDRSLSERLAALLRAGKEISSSKGQQAMKGQGFEGKPFAEPGEMFFKATAHGLGDDKIVMTGQNTALFARALEYAQGTSPVSTILDRMQWMMKAGKQQTRIQLSPPELGHIDLRLVIDKGHLQAHLGTENPLVKEMIESNLSQLKQQLAGLGFVVEEFSVHVGADSRDFTDQEESWGKTEQARDAGLAGAGEESVAFGQPAGTTPEDDRYQVNVRV